MKLKFKKQEFQEKAVNAVANLFKGQEKPEQLFLSLIIRLNFVR